MNIANLLVQHRSDSKNAVSCDGAGLSSLSVGIRGAIIAASSQEAGVVIAAKVEPDMKAILGSLRQLRDRWQSGGEVSDAIKLAHNHPSLLRLEKGGLAPAQWQRFVIERYHATQWFVPLVIRGIIVALLEPNWAALSAPLLKNYRDETGASDPAGGSHEMWRRDFFQALGIRQEQVNLQASSLLAGTKNYNDCLRLTSQSGAAAFVAGALWYLEETIPGEFARILRGCEKDFPALFDNRHYPHDPEMLRARRYLVDHIEHDARSHSPELAYAIMQSLEHSNASNDWCMFSSGILAVAKAKQKFYDNIGIEFERMQKEHLL